MEREMANKFNKLNNSKDRYKSIASLYRVPLLLIKDLPTLEQKVIQCLLSSRIVGSYLIYRTHHLYPKHSVCHCGRGSWGEDGDKVIYITYKHMHRSIALSCMYLIQYYNSVLLYGLIDTVSSCTYQHLIMMA